MKHVFALLIFVGCAPGAGWSRADTTLETVFAAELAGDAHETPPIMARCAESNPFIGACGERTPLVFYIPAAAAVHFAVAWLLPPRMRRPFQLITVGIEAQVVYQNTVDNSWWSGGGRPK